MSLNDQQKRALDHARAVLADDPRPHAGRLTAQWHTAVRMALVDILKAFQDDLEEDDGEPEPVPHVFPAAFHAPWEPGECHGCHGHADHDGTWHAAVAS